MLTATFSFKRGLGLKDLQSISKLSICRVRSVFPHRGYYNSCWNRKWKAHIILKTHSFHNADRNQGHRDIDHNNHLSPTAFISNWTSHGISSLCFVGGKITKVLSTVGRTHMHCYGSSVRFHLSLCGDCRNGTKPSDSQMVISLLTATFARTVNLADSSYQYLSPPSNNASPCAVFSMMTL